MTDEILHNEDLAHLTSEEKDQIRDLFDQGVKHKMKMNFVRQMSKTSGRYMYEINSKQSIKLFSAVGFGRADKDGEREKMLDPVNYGEDEEEGLN